MSDNAQVGDAYEATLKEFGTVDVLINNAALVTAFLTPTGKRTTLETTDEDWETMLGVNLMGTLRVTRRFIQPMIEKKRGSIINVVSSGILNFSRGAAFTALRPWSQEMPYQATKAAVAAMSFYLAEEMKEHNVAVNNPHPRPQQGSVVRRYDAGPRGGGHTPRDPSGGAGAHRADSPLPRLPGRQRHHGQDVPCDGMERGARVRRIRGVGGYDDACRSQRGVQRPSRVVLRRRWTRPAAAPAG